MPYPNRERALRHVKRTQAAYLYGRLPLRYILGMPCCDRGFLMRGREHDSDCPALAHSWHPRRPIHARA